ncbi:MAG: DUF4442 domain-containing protein [Deltaproteobacteria bacterium]|nr:DUF4442 domain-containing protein [Deltaproteobacteria bacterium]
MSASVTADSPEAKKLRRYLSSGPLLRAYLTAKLPMAALAGLKITELDGERCVVTVPYGWRTQNPFGSIYFAALSMAAELSCAGLALTAAKAAPRTVSVLPIRMEGDFEKKATGLTRFTCADGAALYTAVNDALRTGQGVTCVTKTVGQMDNGTTVARFQFTWSFKEKSSR